ncbi:MAG: DUF4245 domain-containing protein [Frankiaceae bacterium]|jgi:hypothetical protein
MSRKRGTETANDMVRSMLVVGGVTLAVLVAGASRQLLFPSGKVAERIRVVDYSNEVAAAQRLSAGDVLAPAGLPPRWRATSARLNPQGSVVDLHVGFVTPAEKYAELEESTGQADAFIRDTLAKGVRVIGSTTIAGVRWEQRRTAKGELALLRTSGRATVIVTGNAAPGELQALASSLR